MHHARVIEKPIEEMIAKLARSSDAVLIVGPTGSGKTEAASRIHAQSAVRDQPFVHMNCAVIPPSLAESALFGSVQGAFTDAKDHIGLLGEAHRGTLFLDEVGELPLEVQAKLLVALEDQRYRRLGGQGEETAEFRLLTATNRDLLEDSRRGRFRLDLYYRIRVLDLVMPPLSARRHAITSFARQVALGVVPDETWVRCVVDVVERLSGHPHAWPGGFRELRSFICRCNQTGVEQQEAQILHEWDRLAPLTDGPALRRIAGAPGHPIDDKARYAGLIGRCLRSSAPPGSRPPKAAEHEVALRLASRLLDRDGAPIARADLRGLLGASSARTLSANLNRLLAHGLVREVGDEIVACWPPAESALLIARGGDWVQLPPTGPARAVSGDRLRIEVRSKLNAEISVMLVTHRPGGGRSSRLIAEERLVRAGGTAIVELVLDDERGLEQILVHLAVATRGGAPVEPRSTEPVLPSAEEIEQGRQLARMKFGEGWLGEHFVSHGRRNPEPAP